MPIWLVNLLPILWKIGKPIAIGVVILAIIGLPILFIHQYGDRHYNQGKKDGYAQAIKENPPQTYGDNAIVNNYQGVIDPLFHLSAGKLEFGFFWRKQ
jgi:hypothetical protein